MSECYLKDLGKGEFQRPGGILILLRRLGILWMQAYIYLSSCSITVNIHPTPNLR